MNKKVKLVKDDERIPDFYTIVIYYHDGKIEEYKTTLKFVNGPFLSICTEEDIWWDIELTGIKKIGYDKNYSKIVAIKEELRLKQEKGNN